MENLYLFSAMSRLEDQVELLFAEAGPVALAPGFEFRPQQKTMALAVAGALNSGGHLLVEAPTGIGKTLAYLIPALLHALACGRTAVISTHTKTLQEQLIRKDIPIVRRILKCSFDAATLKGRRNYLCSTRLQNALASQEALFADRGREELLRIAQWSRTAADGDVEDLPFHPMQDVWDMVCSEASICSGSVCGPGCFYQRAKERARSAEIVIVNHALFFTLLPFSASEERFLFEDDFVVFDEAHTLEAVAGAGAGKSLSLYQLRLALHKLYSPKTKKGLLAGRRARRSLWSEVDREATAFFDTVKQYAKTYQAAGAAKGANAVRVRTPGFMRNSLAEPLAELQEHVHSIEAHAPSPALQQELASARRSLCEAGTLIDGFLEQRDPALTYWIEWSEGSRPNVTLCASPSDIGEVLRTQLFRQGKSVIMTSATLAVRDNAGYFQQRIGAEAIPSLILDSPFNHFRQSRISIARDIAEPESREYAEELPFWILRSIERTGGRALVLFTNASLMHTVAASLAGKLEERNIRLLIQGEDRQRHALLREFRDDVSSVLFGLDSFWYGVDVPGEALGHVIITRLPFSVPSHPLIEARLEAIARRGGNTFLDYTLPEAILKFRQGAGRLIRSSSDRGIISILDSRILHKSYGRLFLSSLPPCPVELLSEAGETEELYGEW
jgi:ATP-dependent DNA helicase DinG